MKDLRTFFLSLDLREIVSLGFLDSKRILIKFNNEANFHQIWSRNVWYAFDFLMSVFKWSPAFHVDKEPLVSPVWFQLSKLPLYYFNTEVLFQIVSVLGVPLFVDSATLAASRPSSKALCRN